ncbi:MAG: cell division protein FtsQ/DivIB [Desulfobulbales bacterium]
MPHTANIKIKTLKTRGVPRRSGRQPFRLIIKIMGLALILLGLGLGTRHVYYRLCQCDFFQITAVRIDGNRMTSKEQIAALSRVDIHSNLLAIDTSQVGSLLESHPWIEKAKVVRDWPNRLLIHLKEKDPVALLNRKTGLFYLDSRGQIIAAANPAQELDFPVITGLENLYLEPQAKRINRPVRDIFDLLRLANRNNPMLPAQNISEIHVTDSGELVIYLLDRPFPIFFGNEDKISTRYYRLIKVLKDLYKTHEFSEVAYIRLDYQKNTILVGKLEADRINHSARKGT